jgi:ribokinase
MSMALTIVGSVNLDLVARVPRLPVPGETVTGATFAAYPGGKGANQALAARRLGASVSLVARVGADAHASAALALLSAEGVDLTALVRDVEAPTGVALIAVDAAAENHIVVAPGANARLACADVPESALEGPLLCQLEVPVEVLESVAEGASGFLALNLAPAREVPAAVLARADLLVVNEVEAAFYGPALQTTRGLVAITFGRQGAALYSQGREIARALPPAVTAVDTTGAGDAFTAALVVALLENRAPVEALRFACAAGALAATRAGAQPALPSRDEVLALAGLAP